MKGEIQRLNVIKSLRNYREKIKEKERKNKKLRDPTQELQYPNNRNPKKIEQGKWGQGRGRDGWVEVLVSSLPCSSV